MILCCITVSEYNFEFNESEFQWGKKSFECIRFEAYIINKAPARLSKSSEPTRLDQAMADIVCIPSISQEALEAGNIHGAIQNCIGGKAFWILGSEDAWGSFPVITPQKYNPRLVTQQGLKDLWKKMEEGKEMLNHLPKYAVHVMVNMENVEEDSLAKDLNGIDIPMIRFKGEWRSGCKAELLNGWHRFMLMKEFVLGKAIKTGQELQKRLENLNLPIDEALKIQFQLKELREWMLAKGKWVAIIYDRSEFSLET